MKRLFAPGCALIIYKPHLAEKLHKLLNENIESMDLLDTCCRNSPSLADNTEVINVCPGCDRRYRENYSNSSTISLWEVLAYSDFFQFPDYKGKKMSIIDACPTRNQERVHKAIRTLLKKMNIELIEPEKTGTKSTCCGDSFWGVLPVPQIIEKMHERTAEMPVEDVVVYCVSCSKSVFIGGKKPHYMVDLLFGEETIPKTYDTAQWHKEIDEFVDKH
jgi:Fe-S oxidoreductase